MPRRKHKKLRRGGSGGGGGGRSGDGGSSDTGRRQHYPYSSNTSKTTTTTSTSIEEDLRQQRIRQQQRQQQKEKEAETTKQQATRSNSLSQQQQSLEHDNDIGDVQQVKPLPQHLLFKGAYPLEPLFHLGNNNNNRNNPSLSLSSSLSLGCLLEQSPLLNARYRRNLRHVWHGKYVLENMGIQKRAFAFYNNNNNKKNTSNYNNNNNLRWLDHSLPNGLYCAWDMACKHYLHPASRTIDVAASAMPVSASATNTFDNNNNNDDQNSNKLPAIATTVQGGWALMQPPRGSQSRVFTMRSKPVHVIRMHEKSGRCGMVVRRNGDSVTPYMFQWYNLPNLTTYYEAGLYAPVNDVCFGTDLALFACPRYYGGSTISPMFMPLERQQQQQQQQTMSHQYDSNLRSLNVHNFPQSDALRVEMTCDHEKYVAFGHRNGQVSLIDLRQSTTTCSIFQELSCGNDDNNNNNNNSHGCGGSATDLGFLKSATQLLVKRSFGSCQLHDLRVSSSYKTNSSVIFNLMVPPNYNSNTTATTTFSTIRETLSAHCNGFAVDPVFQQTLVSPYMNSQQEPCLGIWSLGTGIFIGSKVLARNPDRDMIYTEVCQTTTPAFFQTSTKTTTQRRHSKDSSFGVWLKCGRFADSKSKINAKFGSLHHVTLPGAWGEQDPIPITVSTTTTASY